MPDVSDLAPDFTLPRDGGTTVTLSALRPAPVVLYFYPKDDTPGCTKEALDFTAHAAAFAAAGALIFGVSKDDVKSHDTFVRKHSLGIPLLSDDAGVCEAFSVWKEKAMYGKTYMGIERTTVLIDGTGRIARIWAKVKVDGHAEDVLAAVKAL
jgi:peroxiredoxin Q/BCP